MNITQWPFPALEPAPLEPLLLANQSYLFEIQLVELAFTSDLVGETQRAKVDEKKIRSTFVSDHLRWTIHKSMSLQCTLLQIDKIYRYVVRSVILQCFYQVGTYQMAVMTKAVNKPFYVVAESFKFVRLYPLNQEDVPNRFKVRVWKMCVFYFFRLKFSYISRSSSSSKT